MDQQTIYFYDVPSERVRAEHIFLNNFAESPLLIDGKEYATVEHFYQAAKYPDPEKAEQIRTAPDADQAKKLTRVIEGIRSDWEEVKDAVMLTALQAKFQQNPELRTQLLATGQTHLVEDSPQDPYWGGALPGSKNRLGEMLMQVREQLRLA